MGTSWRKFYFQVDRDEPRLPENASEFRDWLKGSRSRSQETILTCAQQEAVSVGMCMLPMFVFRADRWGKGHG